MTLNDTNCNQKQPRVDTFCNLTEQWKKGELERGWYYVLLFSNEEYITFIDGNWVVDDRLIGSDIKQILAPVPSYEEWRDLEDDLATCDEDLNNVCEQKEELYEENQQLKELLEEIIADADLSYCDSDIELRIDEVLK